MKETEIKLDETGFEEIHPNEPKNAKVEGGAFASDGLSAGDRKQETGNQDQAAGGDLEGANRPDLHVVQTDRDKDGKVIYVNVGGMWKNISKNGKEFYVMRIGRMKLLVFPNDRK